MPILLWTSSYYEWWTFNRPLAEEDEIFSISNDSYKSHGETAAVDEAEPELSPADDSYSFRTPGRGGKSSTSSGNNSSSSTKSGHLSLNKRRKKASDENFIIAEQKKEALELKRKQVLFDEEYRKIEANNRSREITAREKEVSVMSKQSEAECQRIEEDRQCIAEDRKSIETERQRAVMELKVATLMKRKELLDAGISQSDIDTALPLE